MAHWIIEDHGFGGQYYKCSECGETWCDIYHDVAGEENCPHCGAPINEDETEYLDNSKKANEITRKMMGVWVSGTRRQLGAYEELEHKLVRVSGYDIEKLIELFAAGYTLQPPDYKSMTTFDLEKGE